MKNVTSKCDIVQTLRYLDTQNRLVDYLRISITDRCNERCLYCMPEGFSDWKMREDVLSYEEILRIVQVSVKLGFRYFRITGGEPLTRKNVTDFLRELCRLPKVEQVYLSTNGTRLSKYAGDLKRAGIRSLNVSLDSLRDDVYQRVTGGRLKMVLDGLEASRTAGFERIKLNTVLMRGINEEDIWPLVQYAAQHKHPLRFIELMPVSLTEVLTSENFLSVGEVMKFLRTKDILEPMDISLGSGPAKYYRLRHTNATVGFIGAITNLHFCDHCNKIRLTADGKIRPCLGNHGEYDLKPVLRSENPSEENIMEIFRMALREKPPEHLFRNNYQPERIMTAIGG